MKKMVLVALMVFGSLAFGRDFDHREKMEMTPVFKGAEMSQEMVARERGESAEKYTDYHRELMNMDRGHEDR